MKNIFLKLCLLKKLKIKIHKANSAEQFSQIIEDLRDYLIKPFYRLCRHTLFYWASLYCASQVLHFLQTEGRTLHQQKGYTLLY